MHTFCFARVDQFCTEFTTVKRTVIPSRSLRIPELIVTFTLVVGVLGYEILWRLNFLSIVPLTLSVGGTFFPTQTNWWTCWSYTGGCEYDLPKPTDTDVCIRDEKFTSYEKEQKGWKTEQSKIMCRLFDEKEDVVTQSSTLWITTMVRQLYEVNDGTRGWQQVQGKLNQTFTVGAEQMVAFHGTLPPGLQLDNLGQIQGFIKYINETQARRIRCARSGEWLDDCPDVQPFPKHWSRHYPAVSGSDRSPAFAYKSTGCIMTKKLLCHLPELLMAAGVDLDEQEKGPSPRVQGLRLDVQVKLTNWDIGDFWTWPIGLKPKLVIEAKNLGKGFADAPMYTRYEEVSSTVRRRMDHYGINLSIAASASWKNFSLLDLVGVLVVAIGALKYANMFVTSFLVSVYRWLGCSHVSRLYTYNSSSKAANEEQVIDLLDPADFRKRHVSADDAFLEQLFDNRTTSS